MKSTFIIDYNYGDMTGKRIKVRNCINDFEAKGKLHNYLIKKYGERELIITECKKEFIDGFGMFNDIFK